MDRNLTVNNSAPLDNPFGNGPDEDMEVVRAAISAAWMIPMENIHIRVDALEGTITFVPSTVDFIGVDFTITPKEEA